MELTLPLFYSNSFSVNLFPHPQSIMLLFFLSMPLSDHYFCFLLLILIGSFFLFLALSKLRQNSLDIYILNWVYRKTSLYLSNYIFYYFSIWIYFLRKIICHQWPKNIFYKLKKYFFYLLLFLLPRIHTTILFSSFHLNLLYNYGPHPPHIKNFPYYTSPFSDLVFSQFLVLTTSFHI